MFKKYTKRRFLSLILLFIVGCTLVACSGGDEVKLDPKNPVTIIVWHYYHSIQKTAFDDAIKEFNETEGIEKGIIVEAVSIGGVEELSENVKAAANGELDAGNMPNIFGSHGDTALEILNMGKAVAIDEYLTPEELAQYEDTFIHEGRIGTDKLYVFPIAKATESLMLNKTDFDAFRDAINPSLSGKQIEYDDLATWEGILRIAELYERYTDALTPDIENDGKAFMGIDSVANYIIVGSKQLGQDLVEVDNGKATINLDEDIMQKLWNTYYEATVTGRFTKLGRFCSDDIKTGDTLCFLGSTTSASYFPTELTLDNGEVKQIDVMVLPMPVFENAEKYAISQGAGMVIAKSTKDKEYASALFLKWFTQSQRNVTFSLGSGYLPVKKESLDEKTINAAFDMIDSDDIGTQNAIKALKVGITQLKEYTMYSSEVFDGGAAFRNTLPIVISETAAHDRLAFVDLLNDGFTKEQAYAQLVEESRSKFDEWLNSLRK